MYICPNVILCSSMIQRISDSLTHRKRTVLLGKITVNLLSSSRVHANHDNSGSNAPHKFVYRVLQQRCKTQLMERDTLSLKFYCHVSLFTLCIKRIRGMNVHSYFGKYNGISVSMLQYWQLHIYHLFCMA